MDFFSLPFTTDFSSIAFGVLAGLLVAFSDCLGNTFHKNL
ncbi:MAG: hypothetical protein CM1200mP28_08680 [Deltaproteobacteria bacterium]|nr:MAG: hypothetical protein CM1200mP28_08680 [Deltaproteobacteria bacterium]